MWRHKNECTWRMNTQISTQTSLKLSLTSGWCPILIVASSKQLFTTGQKYNIVLLPNKQVSGRLSQRDRYPWAWLTRLLFPRSDCLISILNFELLCFIRCLLTCFSPRSRKTSAIRMTTGEAVSCGTLGLKSQGFELMRWIALWCEADRPGGRWHGPSIQMPGRFSLCESEITQRADEDRYTPAEHRPAPGPFVLILSWKSVWISLNATLIVLNSQLAWYNPDETPNALLL